MPEVSDRVRRAWQELQAHRQQTGDFPDGTNVWKGDGPETLEETLVLLAFVADDADMDWWVCAGSVGGFSSRSRPGQVLVAPHGKKAVVKERWGKEWHESVRHEDMTEAVVAAIDAILDHAEEG